MSKKSIISTLFITVSVITVYFYRHAASEKRCENLITYYPAVGASIDDSNPFAQKYAQDAYFVFNSKRYESRQAAIDACLAN